MSSAECRLSRPIQAVDTNRVAVKCGYPVVFMLLYLSQLYAIIIYKMIAILFKPYAGCFDRAACAQISTDLISHGCPSRA